MNGSLIFFLRTSLTCLIRGCQAFCVAWTAFSCSFFDWFRLFLFLFEFCCGFLLHLLDFLFPLETCVCSMIPHAINAFFVVASATSAGIEQMVIFPDGQFPLLCPYPQHFTHCLISVKRSYSVCQGAMKSLNR